MTTDSIITGRRGELMGEVVNVQPPKTDITDFFWKNNPRRDSRNYVDDEESKMYFVTLTHRYMKMVRQIPTSVKRNLFQTSEA
jgi:hypothetical protein